MEFSVHVHVDYLKVIVRGEFDLVAGKAHVDELYRLCAQHGLSRVLVDALELSEHVSVSSRFNLGEYLAARGTGRTRFAIVTSTQTVHDSKALENTANNRGAQVLTTDSMEKAMEYLGIFGEE